METAGKTLRSRLISLLLAICIAAGFVPLIDYSAFAVDSETTIGVLEVNRARKGNGWSWDGQMTLKLFGTELKSKDDDTPKITFSDTTRPYKIEVTGYNRAVGDSLLAKGGQELSFTGGGILDCNSAGALFDCEKVVIEDPIIKAPDAAFYKDTDKAMALDYNNGYLEIGTLNVSTIFMTNGVINCDTLRLAKGFVQYRSVFYTKNFDVFGDNSNIVIDCQDSAIFKADTIIPTSGYAIGQSGTSIVMVGESNTAPRVGSDNTAVNVNGLNVYCSMVANDTVKEVYSDLAGVYYAANSVKVGDDVTFSGAVYFAGTALVDTSKYFTVAEGATVAGGGTLSIECNKATIGKSSTVFFGLGMVLENVTVNGGVYGCLNAGSGDRMNIQNSTIGADGSVYTLSNDSQFWKSTIDGSVTVYGTVGTPIRLNDTTVNGKIYLYDSSKSKQDLVGISSLTFGASAELAGYTSAGQIFKDTDKSKAFDIAIGSRAFYTAADLGGEFTATVSGYSDNCGKVIYIGNEYEQRFDTAFGYSPWIYDGHFRTYKSLLLSLDPKGDKKAFLAYNSTCDIDNLNDVKVTITKGAENCTDCFDIKLSHYYYTDDDGDKVPDKTIARSLGVEIGATKDYKLTAGDEYKVTVEYNGMKQTETIEVTGVEITLNFTGKYNYSPDEWTYDGVAFKTPNQNYVASTWEWYATENAERGYPAKTLVLNGIDLASSRYNAVVVPNGTTIILKGNNRLYSSASAILCMNGSDANDNGSLTIKGEDGGSLTAISSELAPNGASDCSAAIMISGYTYENQTLLIKDATLNLTAKKTAEVGSSNGGCTNCYGISSDNVIIENRNITAYAGPAGQDGLKSAAIRARDNIIIRGNTTLSLTSEQYALYAGNSIKSIELSRLQGADVTLEGFNSSLKNNGSVYNGNSISGDWVYLMTKPIEQFDDAKTADVLDPDDGEQTLSLSGFFSGGTNSYVFALADGVTLPDWVALAQDGTLTFNAPNIKYAGGRYKLTVADSDPDLRSDPLEFTLVVGKIGRTVKLTVEYDSTLGTVEPETGKVLAGEDAYIEADAKDGAYIDSVTLDGAPVELAETEKTSVGRITSGIYVIEKIDSDHTVSVSFKKMPTYKVSVTKNDGGTVKVETAALADYTYAEGTDVVISAVADSGYRIKSIMLGGAAVTLTDGKYTIKSITANCEFAVEFEAIPTYTVTVTANNGGTVTAETAALAGRPDHTYNEGTDVVISVLAADGYRIKTVTLGGAAVTLTDGKYTIKNIAANCAFAVEFEMIPRVQLAVKTNGNGTVTVDTAALQGLPDYTFFEGTEVSVTITPNAGYTIKSVKLGDESVSVNKGKCVFSLSGDCTLDVEFKKKSSGGSSGGSSGRRNDTDAEQKPMLNGSEKSWTEIANELDKMPSGGSVTILLNDVPTVPAEAIGSIMNKKLIAEFIVDSDKSWIIDGEKVTSASDADLRVINSTSDTGKLRGVCAIDVKANKSDVPAALRLKLSREHAGKFANIYRISRGKLEYFCSAKIGADGIVDIIGAEAGGEYVTMVHRLSCKPGDANNDGILNALDASVILKYAVGLGGVDNAGMADMNGDSAINAIDAYEILKAIINA